jgi:hypothetical protein
MSHCNPKESNILKQDKFNNMQSTHLLKMTTAEANISYSNQNLSEIPKKIISACYMQVLQLDLSNNFLPEITEDLC